MRRGNVHHINIGHGQQGFVATHGVRHPKLSSEGRRFGAATRGYGVQAGLRHQRQVLRKFVGNVAQAQDGPVVGAHDKVS
jgi:hypothetical protein